MSPATAIPPAMNKMRMGQEIAVEGWYRRAVVPYLEIGCHNVQSRERRIWRPSLEIGMSVIVAVLGFFLLWLWDTFQ